MKKCEYCQGTKNLVTTDRKGKPAKKGFDIFIDDNFLCYSYFEDAKQAGSQGVKKIKYCPMCGRKLLRTEKL